MSVFNRIEQAANTDVMKSVNSLNTSLKNIENYHSHRLSAGIESFDSASDKLVVNALTDMYPTHFDMSAGNEGLGALVDKIKKGLSGLKQSISSGKKDKMDKTVFDEAKKEVDNSFDKNEFFGKKDFKGTKQVAVGVLQNYVGKGSKAQILDAIAKIIPQTGKETQKYLQETQAYWKQISGYVDRLKKVPEGDAEAAKAILKEAAEKLPDPYDAVEVNIYSPWAKEESFKPKDTVDALTQEEAENVIVLINKIIDEAKAISTIGDQIVQVGQYFDPQKQLAWLFTAGVGHREVLNNMSWDEFTMPGNIGQSLQIENLMAMGRLMERWINESVG